jgi:hypothetical protein
VSIDRNIYVGPIVRCKFPTKDVTEVIARKCPKCKYEPNDDGDFCSRCGSLVSLTTRKHQESQFYALSDENRGFELFEASDEDDGGRFFPKGEHVYVTNVTKKSQPRKFHLDDEYAHFTLLYPDSIRKEVDWFRGEYATSIKMLVKAYGVTNVSLEWAILRWSS